MKLKVVGCSHHNSSIAFRECVSFSVDQIETALSQLNDRFPEVESVLISTCNRVELYVATESEVIPSREDVAELVAELHGLSKQKVVEQFYEKTEGDAVKHLFRVASSLDSMVIGEPQVLSQVKRAYELATQLERTGVLMHSLFQAALKTARRVATETAIQQYRVSVPSVAVADFARQIFERFDDKKILVIGAGEMAEETLRYLQDEGAHDVTVVNRNPERAAELARRWRGKVIEWNSLQKELAKADLVISTTGSKEPIVTTEQFKQVEEARTKWPLFVLDLAVPRDFEPDIGEWSDVFLFSIDDLRDACEKNCERRKGELPKAQSIVEQEAARLVANLRHRVTGPIIRRLKQGLEKPKEEELCRLLAKLPELDENAQKEIRRSFDRLLNKVLHSPLTSLREESRHGMPNVLLDAMKKLFKLTD